MLLEGIQSLDLCKIRSGAGDKKTTGVNDEIKLNSVYGTEYRINLDHPFLTDHGVFYPQALYHDLVFELTLAGKLAGKRLGCDKARVQVGKHPAGVRDNKK